MDVKTGICEGGTDTGIVSIEDLSSNLTGGTRFNSDRSASLWRILKRSARAGVNIFNPREHVHRA